MTNSSDRKITIAIDGYSSSGKSTMARALASAIGYRYIDSGAMYRAVTLWAMRNGLVAPGVEPDVARIVEGLPQLSIDFKVDGPRQLTTLDGEVVEDEIRSLEVSNCVSPIAAIPQVRHALVTMQKAMGQSKGIVMDGRDIGTVVFPDAEMKVFCDASAEQRARRRFKELTDKGAKVTYEDVLDNVRSRDHIDETRSEGPLRCADDAVRLDNSEMTIDEQNLWLLDLYNKRVSQS